VENWKLSQERRDKLRIINIVTADIVGEHSFENENEEGEEIEERHYDSAIMSEIYYKLPAYNVLLRKANSHTHT
jgi:hypothetical protein